MNPSNSPWQRPGGENQWQQWGQPYPYPPGQPPGVQPYPPSPRPPKGSSTYIWIIGGFTATALVIGLVVALVVMSGGGSNSNTTPADPDTSPAAEAQSAPSEPAEGYDISRMANMTADFPSGFNVTKVSHYVVTQQMVDMADAIAGGVKPIVDPPQCVPATHSNVAVDEQMQTIKADGPQHIEIIAGQTTQENPASRVPTDCEHVVLTAAGGAHGSEDGIPSPTISGVPTYAFKLHWDSAPITGQTKDTYRYVAVLSERTVAGVNGESDPELLQDLLVKAVAAIRGQ